MKKCSVKAFAICPNRTVCGSLKEAVYMEGSECEKFNEAAESTHVTNADRIRAMSDEELAAFLCGTRSDDSYDGCAGCAAEDYCYAGHTGMIDWLKEKSNEN